jgi:hypothetical protein
MISLFHNTTALVTEKLHQPQSPITIIQDYVQAKNHATRNLYIQVEPEAIYPVEAKIIRDAKHYDFILTFNEEILRQCPNAVKYTYGTTWISPDDFGYVDVTKKLFRMTSITGDKLMTAGHRFRHRIYYDQARIQSIPTIFYRSDKSRLPTIGAADNNPCLPAALSSKIQLFREEQYSLVIENSRQQNYFTEKLCDCLITKTIPVYYGCPNIADYFDTTGWVILEKDSADELVGKLEQQLTPDHYERCLPVIEKNFETTRRYIDFHENINEALRKLPGY